MTDNAAVSKRGRMPSGAPNPVDAHVGARIRLRRTLLGLSQQVVARTLGITFQQVQKYERGDNRISASRLWDMCCVLDCDMQFLFEGMSDDIAAASPRHVRSNSQDIPSCGDDPLSKRETLELVRVYYRISDSNIRQRLYEFARSLAPICDAPKDDVAQPAPGAGADNAAQR